MLKALHWITYGDGTESISEKIRVQDASAGNSVTFFCGILQKFKVGDFCCTFSFNISMFLCAELG